MNDQQAQLDGLAFPSGPHTSAAPVALHRGLRRAVAIAALSVMLGAGIAVPSFAHMGTHSSVSGAHMSVPLALTSCGTNGVTGGPGTF
ncbi:MAG: hypothetical protein ACHQ4H_06480 [Ktedonobacterales bacterium]